MGPANMTKTAATTERMNVIATTAELMCTVYTSMRCEYPDMKIRRTPQPMKTAATICPAALVEVWEDQANQNKAERKKS